MEAEVGGENVEDGENESEKEKTIIIIKVDRGRLERERKVRRDIIICSTEGTFV